MTTKRVTVLRKEVYGSLCGEDYQDDLVLDVIAWLRSAVEEVPQEYRSEAKIEIANVAGYEGESHVEVEIYYFRPETLAERDDREARTAREERRREAMRRLQYEELKRIYGHSDDPSP